jgi:hypothetical protein
LSGWQCRVPSCRVTPTPSRSLCLAAPGSERSVRRICGALCASSASKSAQRGKERAGLTLPRSAVSDARCRAHLAQPSSQLPRDDLTPTTRQSMLLAEPAAFRVEPRVRRLAAADGQAPTDIHTRASAAAPTAPAGRGTDALPRRWVASDQSGALGALGLGQFDIQEPRPLTVGVGHDRSARPSRSRDRTTFAHAP